MRIFLFAAYLVAVSTDAAPLGCGDHSSRPRVQIIEDTDFFSDTDVDAYADGDGDEDTVTSEQAPIEIHVSNATAAPVYVDLSMGQNGVVSCARADGTDCFLFEPFCTRDCEGVLLGESCDNGVCDPYPRVRQIDADNPLVLTFDGLLRVENNTHCTEGTCYDLVPMPKESYALTLHTWTGYTCIATDCPLEDNTIGFASPSGDRRDITFPFESPHNEAVEFEITQ